MFSGIFVHSWGVRSFLTVKDKNSACWWEYSSFYYVLYSFYWFPALYTYQMFLCVFDPTPCPVNEVLGFSHIARWLSEKRPSFPRSSLAAFISANLVWQETFEELWVCFWIIIYYSHLDNILCLMRQIAVQLPLQAHSCVSLCACLCVLSGWCPALLHARG